MIEPKNRKKSMYKGMVARIWGNIIYFLALTVFILLRHYVTGVIDVEVLDCIGKGYLVIGITGVGFNVSALRELKYIDEDW